MAEKTPKASWPSKKAAGGGGLYRKVRFSLRRLCLTTTRVLPFAYGGDPEAGGPDVAKQKAFWLADAWGETIICRTAFVLTLVYELLPPLVAAPLCWCIEGTASAQNRGLMPKSLSMESFRRVVMQSLVTVPAWSMMLVWLATRPADVPGLEVGFPCMMMGWRAACIAMKYAYFSPSDLMRVQESLHWSRTRNTDRQLGVHKYFNMAGVLAFDRVESLFKTALRTGVLEEVKDNFLTLDPETAGQIWSEVRPELEPAYVDQLHTKFVPCASEWRSKYGDVPGMLGLSDLAAIEALVAEGKLPVSVVAYYFIHICQMPAWAKVFVPGIMLSGAALAFLHPLTLHIFGKPGFGTSAAGRLIHGMRALSLMVLMAPVYLYLSFPVIDAYRRDKMSLSLLAAFGRGEARAERLIKEGIEDPLFQIESVSDLRAFWCLTRLLGPVHEIGLMHRYNSAFTAVHVFFLCVATAGLKVSSWHGEVAWGVTAELVALFASGAASVLAASLRCVFVNEHVSMFVGLARHAAIRHPELGRLAENICNNLIEEHTILNPVRILYMPATPALLSLIWSGLVVLTTVFVSALPNVCMPFFAFGRGCLN